MANRSTVETYRAAIRITEETLRGTGRSTEQIASLSEGDIFIVHNPMLKAIAEKKLRHRGVTARVEIVTDRYRIREIKRRNSSRVVIDHHVQERLIHDALNDLHHLVETMGSRPPPPDPQHSAIVSFSPEEK